MKKKIIASVSALQAVVIANDEWQSRFLTRKIFEKPLIAYQLETLVEAGVTDLIVVIQTNNDKLRKYLRQWAIQQPIKLRTVNNDLIGCLSDNLIAVAPYVKSRFFLTQGGNIFAGFYLEEMKQWQAEIVVSCQTEKIRQPVGTVKVQKKIATDFSKQVIKDYQYLTDNYFITAKFVEFLVERQLTMSNWWAQALHEWAQLNLIKACQFAAVEQMPERTSQEFWLWLHEHFFSKKIKVIADDCQLAPTVRLKGEVIIESEAQVGEYVCIEGPCYVGSKVVIENFCNLRPRVFLTAGTQVKSYQQLQNCLIETEKF